MPEPVTVAVDPTPNPNALKFTLNRVVAAKGETYREASTAAPWAAALLQIPGVLGVYGVNNFISVNKSPEANWQAIVPEAEAALRRVFT
jgi:hypothetical protein